MPTTTVSTRPRRAIVALATSIAFAAAAAHDASALSLPPSTYQDCAEALLKTSSTLLKKREKAIFQCTDDLLACRLDADLAAGNWAACSAPVAASCESSLAKLQEKEAGVAAKLAKKCGSLADHDFGSSVGLGMRRLLEECGAVTSAPEAYECFLSRLRCAAADIVETVQPRAYEVLQSSGVLTAEADQFACLDVRAPVVPAGGDPVALAECSSGLAAALSKPLLKTPKDLAACVGDLLECRLRADRLQTNRPQPPGCYGESAPASSCAKAEDKLAAALGAEVATAAAESCTGLPAATVLDALGLGDACSSAATLADVATCVQGLLGDRTLLQLDETVPRICQLSTETGQAVFALGEFCAPQCGDRLVRGTESCDDGNLDPNDGCSNSCATGPTEHESHSLPASVHPAHTPDGTMLNAVDPGSSVAVQFGTTTPDLNNVAYVRYHAPGAGDPDAVLVLVPGFAGGAHSLKIVAETMVAKAAAEGSINLEVWTFDRRTDQLEDDGGGELAESEDDPALAIDWYFGGELGLALDSRLSRRAVFHDGADIPFIGNFTYNMFIHDIDDVVDAAHAMPGSPTVFLGGHSLGTLFSARYAATDLDPGVAVVPGHTKVAGLVLFEGGGDSMPIAPPPSDDLDLVIAKHDGGLYHAIRTGAASCWDGTPCPGGDPDCSALALPAGAVTNKCVQPVEAFAGSVISPQIHAVGDAVVVQARRHPDSLSIAQTPFGAQTPIQAVPGLSLLGFLPRGSAEATVGFFLDDDYSPEVSFQASMGFSNNGPNTDLGTYYLAGPAPNDPYRLWMGIDAAMPAAAVVDHGAPSGAFALNGVEDEMTTMANMLTMVRSGDRNIGDWYFPSSGLELTKELIVGVGGFTGGLDSTALSVGRGRPDIENLTEGPGIGIPVICFGGSNGISPTDGAMLPFAESIGPCTAPSCDGTPRVVTSDPIHPAYGDVAGGFESWIGPGYAHIDVVSGEDDAGHAEVYPPLLAFLERNTTP